MIRRLLLLALPVLVLAVGFLAARYMLDTRREVAPSDEPVVEAGQPGDVATVTTMAYRLESVRPELVLYGQVRAQRQVQVLARTGGDITELAVEEGDRVAAGDLLARLDSRDAERQLARAENRLQDIQSRERQEAREQQVAEEALQIEDELVDIAERSMRRTRDLQQRNLASASDLEDAERNLQQQRLSRNQQQSLVEGHEDRVAQLAVERRELELDISELEERLQDTELRARFDGEVTALEVEVGDRVAAEAPLLTLLDRSQLRVLAQLPAHHAPLLDVGMQATLETDDGREQILSLRGWEPVSRGGSLRLRFAVEDPDALAVADRHHRLRLAMPEVSAVAPIPVNALYENRFVYRVEDASLQRIAVEVAGFRGNGTATEALISSDDLSEGDQLLTTRLANAVSGLPVLVRED